MPIFILLVIVSIIQILEQWYFEYPATIKSLFPSSFESPVIFNETIFISIFLFCGTTLYLLGAFGIFFHHPLGNFVAWFLMIFSLINSLDILIMPFLAGSIQYLPGMIVAPFIIVLSIVGMIQLIKKTEKGYGS